MAQRPDALDACWRRKHLMRDIEPHGDDRPPAAEHDVRRVWIDEHVELGGRRGVAAFAHRAAHEDDLADLRQDRRLTDHRHGDVGQRPRRHECDGVMSRRHESGHDEVHSVLWLQLVPWLADLHAVDSGVAVHGFGGDELAHHRARAARVDADVIAPR
jgi:hypothetical protein